MIDRLFINAVDLHGTTTHLAVHGGRFVAISRQRPEVDAAELIDLQGNLVLPGFVDGHIHLDKSFVGDGWRSHVPTDSLRERLAIEKQLLADARPITERVNALIEQAVAFGTMAMRCHVDVDGTTGLTNLHAVVAGKERWRDLVDIEIVAFPQAGVMSCKGTAEFLEAALGEGADVVGGIDPTTLDGAAQAQLDLIFGLAEKHQAKLDIHLHEPGQQGITQLLSIAQRTQELGMSGRVAVSHAYALGEVPLDVVDSTAAALAGAGVSIMTNAPGDRPFPPVRRLRAAGVRMFAGNDNIRDAWWPYGNGDILQRAMLIGYRSGFYTDQELLIALDMITAAAAGVIGKDDYGLAVGNEASFIVLNAHNGAEAVAGAPADRLIVRRGEFWRPSSPWIGAQSQRA